MGESPELGEFGRTYWKGVVLVASKVRVFLDSAYTAIILKTNLISRTSLSQPML